MDGITTPDRCGGDSAEDVTFMERTDWDQGLHTLHGPVYIGSSPGNVRVVVSTEKTNVSAGKKL